MSFSIKEHKPLLLKRLLMIIHGLLHCKGRYRDPSEPDSLYICAGLLATLLPVHHSLVRLHTSLSSPILLPSPDFLYNVSFSMKIPSHLWNSIPPSKMHLRYSLSWSLSSCLPRSVPLPTSPYWFVEYVLERALWEFHKSSSSKIIFSEQPFIWNFKYNIISVFVYNIHEYM